MGICTVAICMHRRFRYLQHRAAPALLLVNWFGLKHVDIGGRRYSLIATIFISFFLVLLEEQKWTY